MYFNADSVYKSSVNDPSGEFRGFLSVLFKLPLWQRCNIAVFNSHTLYRLSGHTQYVLYCTFIFLLSNVLNTLENTSRPLSSSNHVNECATMTFYSVLQLEKKRAVFCVYKLMCALLEVMCVYLNFPCNFFFLRERCCHVFIHAILINRPGIWLFLVLHVSK